MRGARLSWPPPACGHPLERGIGSAPDICYDKKGMIATSNQSAPPTRNTKRGAYPPLEGVPQAGGGHREQGISHQIQKMHSA